MTDLSFSELLDEFAKLEGKRVTALVVVADIVAPIAVLRGIAGRLAMEGSSSGVVEGSGPVVGDLFDAPRKPHRQVAVAFLPIASALEPLAEPGGAGVRIDAENYTGATISPLTGGFSVWLDGGLMIQVSEL